MGSICQLLMQSTMMYSAVFASTLFALVSSNPQFGFLDNIVNFFRPASNNNNINTNSNNISSGPGGCNSGGNRPNYQFGGKDYLVSWRLGCSRLTQARADNFCRQNNMRPISIDSFEKQREFLGLVSRENQRFFWTGGRVRGGNIQWPSGRSFNNVNWSHTGGAGRRQPDNREGNESCLAVLNNFYNDGVKFHDVACHHQKPVICEA